MVSLLYNIFKKFIINNRYNTIIIAIITKNHWIILIDCIYYYYCKTLC